jgi:hypothetical protein
MEQSRQVMKQIINVTEEALNDFLRKTFIKNFKRQEIVNRLNAIPNQIFLSIRVLSGLL